MVFEQVLCSEGKRASPPSHVRKGEGRRNTHSLSGQARATHESKALNMLLSVPCGAIYSLLLVAIVGYVLGASEAAYLFAPVLVIPFNLLLGAYKKRRERIIDRLALEEALSVRCGGPFFFFLSEQEC